MPGSLEHFYVLQDLFQVNVILQISDRVLYVLQ